MFKKFSFHVDLAILNLTIIFIVVQVFVYEKSKQFIQKMFFVDNPKHLTLT